MPDFFWASKYFGYFSSKIELMDKIWVLAPVCDRHKVKLIQYRIEGVWEARNYHFGVDATNALVRC